MNLILTGKKIIAATLYYSGVLKSIQLMNNYSGIILAYHRVLPKDSNDIAFIQPGMYVTLETFKKHMAFISKRYQVINLHDIAGLYTTKRACIVTFDDGWADNYTHAFPVLKKYAIPATIFLATNMVGTNQWPWPDRISYYIQTTSLDKFVDVMEAGLDEHGRERFKIDNFSRNKKNIVDDILGYMKKLDHRKLITLMTHFDHEFYKQMESLNEKRQWLTWEEVVEMSHHGIAFGAHTHNHVILTSVSLNDAREEIVTSRDILSRKLGSNIRSFNYPNGDYNKALVNVLKDEGFTYAVTTRTGYIKESDDLLTLRRIMLHEDMTKTIPMLACKLTGRIPFF